MNHAGLFKDTRAEDASLLEAVRARDQRAMSAIYDRYSGMIFSVALQILKCPSEAEDIMQELLIQVWRDPIHLNPTQGSLGIWLAVVARIRAIDALRKRRPTEPIEDVALAGGPDVAKEAEHNVLLQRVRSSMKGLPQSQREALEMTFFGGLTQSEIAAETGHPLGTIKTRVRLGLRSLHVSVVEPSFASQPAA